MTGAEHYKWAESLLKTVEEDPLNPDSDPIMLAIVQAHATLALAAATAHSITELYTGYEMED